MPVAEVNGTELYHEVRGSGPPLLLIMGATGDGGVFAEFADVLADDFTVVTYDRRGNGRSPVPAGWDATSPEEQADDAAALLDALDLIPGSVFGTSMGGIFALTTLLRHRHAVRAAVLHEPSFFGLADDPAAARAEVSELVTPAMQAGGPTAAFEAFLRFAAGDSTFERLDTRVRERMLASAGTYFTKEIGRFDAYLPDDQAVAANTAAIHLLGGEDSHPGFGQAAGRLAARLNAKVTSVPGGHFGYVEHPHELANTVKALLTRAPESA